MSSNLSDARAAIVCSHVAREARPILYAERGEPLQEVDSGWQFLCNGNVEETPDDAEVWGIDEILEREPTLIPYINMPPGTRLMRGNAGAEWHELS
jgi:hypothetical protein